MKYEIYDLIDTLVFEEVEIDILHIATEYLKEDRYPNPNYSLPPKDEIRRVLDFTDILFSRILIMLDISKLEITNDIK